MGRRLTGSLDRVVDFTRMLAFHTLALIFMLRDERLKIMVASFLSVQIARNATKSAAEHLVVYVFPCSSMDCRQFGIIQDFTCRD